MEFIQTLIQLEKYQLIQNDQGDQSNEMMMHGQEEKIQNDNLS